MKITLRKVSSNTNTRTRGKASKKNEKTEKQENISVRRRRMETLGDGIMRLMRPHLGKQGITAIEILTAWPHIVGPKTARYSCPTKLTRPRFEGEEGVLHIRVSSGAFAVEMQHMKLVIIQRVNSYFGYRAVGDIRLVQGPLSVFYKPKNPPLEAPPLQDQIQEKLQKDLEGITDPALRTALERLGQRVLGEDPLKIRK